MKQRIRILKIAFLFLAASLIAFLFFMTEGRNTQLILEAPEFKKEALREQNEAETTMLSPRFFGEDQKNRRWEVTADKAIQHQKEKSMSISLENIEAHATMKEGDKIYFRALTGVFNRKSHALELSGNVKAKALGYTLNTPQLEGNLFTQQFEAAPSVLLKGQTLKLTSHKMFVENQDHVRFEGQVKGVASTGTFFADALFVYPQKRYAYLKGKAQVVLPEEQITLGAEHIKAFLTEGQGLESIEADTHATVVHGKTTAVAQKVIYRSGGNDVILQGDVKVTQNGNLITGDKMVYNIQTGNVKLHQRDSLSDSQTKKRVRARFSFEH